MWELVAGMRDVLQPWGTYCRCCRHGGLVTGWGLVGGGGARESWTH